MLCATKLHNILPKQTLYTLNSYLFACPVTGNGPSTFYKELSPVSCDNLGVGWWGEDGRTVQEGWDICIPVAVRVAVWQRPAQYCRALVLQYILFCTYQKQMSQKKKINTLTEGIKKKKGKKLTLDGWCLKRDYVKVKQAIKIKYSKCFWPSWYIWRGSVCIYLHCACIHMCVDVHKYIIYFYNILSFMFIHSL